MFIWIGAQSVELTLYGMKVVPSASEHFFKKPLDSKNVSQSLIGKRQVRRTYTKSHTIKKRNGVLHWCS